MLCYLHLPQRRGGHSDCKTYFVGSLLKKKKNTVERMGYLENTYLNSWKTTAGSFFFFLPSHFHLGFKKKPQFDIGFRTKFSKKYLAREHAWNSH